MISLRHKKAIILAVLLLSYSVSLCAQEKWEAQTCHYTNHTWHFHWNLDRELEWEKVQPDEPHTVFKVISPYGLIAFVNIVPISVKEQDSFDFWHNYDVYKLVLEKSWAKIEERTGLKTTPIKIEKCRFFGENAVKVLVRADLLDDVVNETSYGYTYAFHKDGATWQVSVKVSPEIWNAVGENSIKELFIGFAPNAK